MKSLAIVLLLIIPIYGLASGGVEGNGSASFVCTYVPYSNQGHQQQRQKVSYFYDLWEAEQANSLTHDGLKIVYKDWESDNRAERDLQVKREVTAALQRLRQSSEGFYKSVSEIRNKFENEFNDYGKPYIQKADSGLAFPPDLKPVHSLKSFGYNSGDCEPSGAARWRPLFQALLYDEEVKQHYRTATDEAAMWVHEYIYAAITENGMHIESSFAVRFMVGFLFSDVDPKDYPFNESKPLYTDIINNFTVRYEESTARIFSVSATANSEKLDLRMRVTYLDFFGQAHYRKGSSDPIKVEDGESYPISQKDRASLNLKMCGRKFYQYRIDILDFKTPDSPRLITSFEPQLESEDSPCGEKTIDIRFDIMKIDESFLLMAQEYSPIKKGVEQ